MANEKNFSIRETVNKNIERVQFPAFNNHRSLIGWCGMNYPKVLMNPQYMAKPKAKEPIENLDYIFQMRAKQHQNQNLIKPFTNFMLTNQAIQVEKVGSLPYGYKKSLMTLTTTSPEKKAEILKETFKENEKFTTIRPLSCELGSQQNSVFTRKIRQIGEVHYTPSYENEEIRHLKKLPNQVITEQNLIEILSPELLYLNMHNHTWINKEQVNKIGYFAPNISELILSSTDLDDNVLIELGKSCKKLKRIDVSSCKNLTERGIRTFLDLMNHQLESFKCAHNILSSTDYSLEPLRYAPNLKMLNVSFCNNLSSNILQFLIDSECKLQELQIASTYIVQAIAMEGLTHELLSQIILNSKDHLESLDISFIPSKDVNEIVMIAVSQCKKIQSLILSGCIHINDVALQKLGSGGGLPLLSVLKLGGLINVSDNGLTNILQQSPNVKQLELNNLERLTENALELISKFCQKLEIVNLNFTPNISDQKIIEKRAQLPGLTIVRTINKMTDIKDDGMRMPLPLKSVVMQRPKKKKKKK